MPYTDYHAVAASIMGGTIHGGLLSSPLEPAGLVPVAKSALSSIPDGMIVCESDTLLAQRENAI